MADLQWAAIVALVAFGLSYVAPAVFGASLLASTPTSGGPVITSNEVEELTAIAVVSAGVLAVAFALLRRGLVQIKDPEFRTPATLTILAIVGVLLLALADAALLSTAATLSTCLNAAPAGDTNATVQCLNGSNALVGLLGAGVFGLIAIIGYVGSAVGLYRFGRRHQSTILQVGAVLFCIPYLNLIGALLYAVGLHTVKSQLAQGPTAAAFGFP